MCPWSCVLHEPTRSAGAPPGARAPLVIDMPMAEALKQPHADFEGASDPLSLVVVDDDRYIVTLLEDVFQQEGMEVQSFTNSVEAQAHLRSHRADLVITDIKMPDVTGLDLLRDVKQRSPETLVIIITGYASLQTTLEAVQLGAFDYITKPFLLGEVKLVVQRAVEQLNLERENGRLLSRVQELEGEFQRLQESFDDLSREYMELSGQIQGRGPMPPEARQMMTARQAIRPYAEQVASVTKHASQLEMLEDLHRRGVLSDSELEAAKRRLREATG